MIGCLPTSLKVDGEDYGINSDFRVALLIFEAFNDAELDNYGKVTVCLKALYKEVPDNKRAAYSKAIWFLDGGDMPKSKKAPKKLLDWEQDESIIFPAINKVAGYETRTEGRYLHWWSFLGMFNEIGEGLFSQVMNIRAKQSKRKKLSKPEREFYSEHKELVDLKCRYTPEEYAEMERIKSLID